MTYNELNEMTVLQLRKLAKEHSVVLGAGIDKAGIIQKLLSVLPEQDGSESPAPEAEPLAEPKYQAAWHNSTNTPRYSSKPAYQAPGSAPRPAWLNTTPAADA